MAKSSKKNSRKVNKKLPNLVVDIKKRRDSLLKRRSHKSFKLTRRRDYVRSWQIPGYWAFTNEVRTTLWNNKWLFAKFITVYSVLSLLIVGFLSQDSYDLLDKTVNQIGGDVIAGELSGLVQNIAIFSGVVGGAFGQNLNESQQVYAGLLFLLGWMTMVWLLRQLLAGHKKLKLRDGLYSSGSPILSTFIISLVILVQLLPLAVAFIAYGAAYSVDIFSNTLLTTLFWVTELILILISSYWLTSTIIGMVIVTLPGMYPLKALKASGDLVSGRRLRILYRLAWLAFTILLIWAIVVIPAILLARISWLSWLPIIPVVVLILSSVTLTWSSAYIYLLYRKLVSDESKST